MKRTIIALLVLLVMVVSAHAEESGESVVFTGMPEIRISEGGISRIPEKVSGAKAIQFKCTIARLNEKHYWTSRANVQLIPIESGAFVTYLAVNGSGYIRIIRPEMKSTLTRLYADDPEMKFDYVEHLLVGLRSVTYYGRSE